MDKVQIGSTMYAPSQKQPQWVVVAMLMDDILKVYGPFDSRDSAMLVAVENDDDCVERIYVCEAQPPD